MTPRQMTFVILVGAGIVILIMELIRRRMMREKYSLLWVLIAFFLVTVPWFYQWYVKIAHFVGIREVNSFFFYIAIMGLVLLSLQFSISISTAFRQRKALSQQIALLEKRVHDLEGNEQKTGSS